MRCPFCGLRTELSRVVPVAERYGYAICDRCGGAVLTPSPTKAVLAKIYSRKRYFRELAEASPNPVVQTFLQLRLFATPAEWVITEFSRGSVLDVGCGNGEFLQELKKHEWLVSGSDISQVAADSTEQVVGKGTVKVGQFPRQHFAKKFDVISFWHVLEHVANPLGYLSHARSLLKPGGVTVGEVPNFDSFALHLFRSRYSWLMLPEHCLYFSKRSLITLLKRGGYKSIRVYCVPRALLNLALSIDILLRGWHWPKAARQLTFALTIPLSLLFGLVNTTMDKGEVLRFKAHK